MIVFQPKNPMLTMANGLSQPMAGTLSGSMASGLSGGSTVVIPANARYFEDGTTLRYWEDGTTIRVMES